MPETVVGGIAADQLRSIVERVERLHEERAALGADIKDVFAEARSNGFDVPALKAVIAKRRKDAAELDEFQTMVELYEHALGMATPARAREAAE
jgi:uncharacterized protein (UPF0335 family)